MPATPLRLPPKTRKALEEIAETTGVSLQQALEQAVEERQRRLYLDGLNADYEALKQNPAEWTELQEENAAWDVSNDDGLESA